MTKQSGSSELTFDAFQNSDRESKMDYDLLFHADASTARSVHRMLGYSSISSANDETWLAFVRLGKRGKQ